MKTHLFDDGDTWEEVDQLGYDSYIYNQLHHLEFKLYIKANKCIDMFADLCTKFGNEYKYNNLNREKLHDLKLLLKQSNEAYIIRKHHIQEEMDYLKQKYKK